MTLMMQHSEWETDHLKDNPTPCCDCCEEVRKLTDTIRSLEIKLTVASTTGERLNRLSERLQGEVARLKPHPYSPPK